jgi:hypothetical protein
MVTVTGFVTGGAKYHLDTCANSIQVLQVLQDNMIAMMVYLGDTTAHMDPIFVTVDMEMQCCFGVTASHAH